MERWFHKALKPPSAFLLSGYLGAFEEIGMPFSLLLGFGSQKRTYSPTSAPVSTHLLLRRGAANPRGLMCTAKCCLVKMHFHKPFSRYKEQLAECKCMHICESENISPG
jgi:hypothetical protein